MSAITDQLLKDFTQRYSPHRRLIENRDKALIPGPYGRYRQRYYLHPVECRYDKKTRAYIPARDTPWEFWLYNTPIVTVRPDDTATINCEWYSYTTFKHVEDVLDRWCRSRIYWYRPNKWTAGSHVITINGATSKLFDGLRVNLATGAFINPQEPACLVVRECDEVKAIRSALRKVKLRYSPMAKLHDLAWRDSKGKNNPFEGVEARPKEYEDLIAETEPVAQTYVWLVQGIQTHYWWQGYTPTRVLDRTLQMVKNSMYQDYLVQR